MKKTIWWLGWIWLIGGGLCIIWAIWRLGLAEPLRALPVSISPEADTLLSALLLPPWSELAAGAAGIALILCGMGLLLQRGWVRIVLVTTHSVMAGGSLIGWMAVWLLQQTPETRWWPGPVIALALTVLHGGLAFWLNSLDMAELFAWLPLQTTVVASGQCEFCHQELDPQTGQCPHCAHLPESSGDMLTARLIRIQDDASFWLNPGRETLIGRGSLQNDINLNNPTVSRQHARINYEAGQFVLTALHDSNGTWVNDTQVRQQALRSGDEIRLGRARFRFVIEK